MYSCPIHTDDDLNVLVELAQRLNEVRDVANGLASDLRREAVRLNDLGVTAQQMALRLGLTRGRIGQLLMEGRRNG